ncbi:MAG: FAD-binding protein [Beijerinckiaceae bacterium]|nr:FAD-binding protein [Beijerinckiaceae bacterium]
MQIASTLTPATEAELVDCVLEARSTRTPLAIEGGGTRAALGRPIQTARTVSTKAMTGITLHEPAEMIVAARAGTPLAEVERTLALKGQRLAFEPMDHRTLLGSDGDPSIGAVAAMNNSGPRRIAVGAARDSLVGVRFVNGRGEAVKNGGRVMKNVTGLDLVKLLSGSFGTLGILSEVTFKVLPIPESAVTLVYKGLSDAKAIALLTKAIGSPFEVTGAAHLPAGMGRYMARSFIRIEGFAESVDYRFGALKELLSSDGSPSRLEGPDADRLWKAVRDVEFLAEPRDAVIWRVSVKPTDGPKLLDALGPGFSRAHFFDWGGGLVWLATDPAGDGGAARLRAALARLGGYARLERGPAEMRAAEAVFEPLAAPLMQLSAGIKTSFDPDGILNAGRMYAAF